MSDLLLRRVNHYRTEINHEKEEFLRNANWKTSRYDKLDAIENYDYILCLATKFCKTAKQVLPSSVHILENLVNFQHLYIDCMQRKAAYDRTLRWWELVKNIEKRCSQEKEQLIIFNNELLEIRPDYKFNEEEYPQEKCYIATAVYGNYNAPEVIILRKYRDNVLQKHFLGRLFIKTYYILSPNIAKWLKNQNRISLLVKNFLDSIVTKL